MDLEVTIISAKGLRNADGGWFDGKSDPYCVCKIAGLPSYTDRTRFRTRVVKDCLDPKWQETSIIRLASQVQYLEFEIWDQDVGSAEFLGKAVLNPRRVPLESGFEGDLKLTGAKATGSVRVRVTKSCGSQEISVSEFCCCGRQGREAEVQQLTNTKIGIRDIPGDTENRSLNIAGPLPNACAAYMLMMKRYLDSEAQARAGSVLHSYNSQSLSIARLQEATSSERR
ncbi:SYT4 [Symbiodinium natans]|uniref:SYT4 protein n=1 Tax=Symbiodinium natans TaxID=878477 RepID=A0A812R6W2_9DINO|nr:SYT4 [Symbiodinium natans]